MKHSLAPHFSDANCTLSPPFEGLCPCARVGLAEAAPCSGGVLTLLKLPIPDRKGRREGACLPFIERLFAPRDMSPRTGRDPLTGELGKAGGELQTAAELVLRPW